MSEHILSRCQGTAQFSVYKLLPADCEYCVLRTEKRFNSFGSALASHLVSNLYDPTNAYLVEPSYRNLTIPGTDLNFSSPNFMPSYSVRVQVPFME